MCGRSTYKLTWEEIVRLYRLTLELPPVNTQARFNVCPTTTIDTIVGQNGERRLMPMRWGLVPSWWSKPVKELKLATFNARAETVAEKPFFREAFKRNRCLIPVSGYYEWQDMPDGKQPWYFTARDGSPALTIAGLWDEWPEADMPLVLANVCFGGNSGNHKLHPPPPLARRRHRPLQIRVTKRYGMLGR